jgi:hypothetical protein
VEAAGTAADRAIERRQEAEAALEQRRRRLRDLENARTVQPGTLTDARQRRDDLWARITHAWLNPTAVTAVTRDRRDRRDRHDRARRRPQALPPSPNGPHTDDIADQCPQAQVDAS